MNSVTSPRSRKITGPKHTRWIDKSAWTDGVQVMNSYNRFILTKTYTAYTTKAASVRKQLGPKNSKSDAGRQAKNGGVKGVQRSLTERLARSRLQWAGHVERMADHRLLKRAAELREEGRRRRGRPRLRWEDCVKRDVRKAGEREDWKKKTRDRGGWKRLSDEAVKKLRAAYHLWQRDTRKREIPYLISHSKHTYIWSWQYSHCTLTRESQTVACRLYKTKTVHSRS